MTKFVFDGVESIVGKGRKYWYVKASFVRVVRIRDFIIKGLSTLYYILKQHPPPPLPPGIFFGIMKLQTRVPTMSVAFLFKMFSIRPSTAVPPVAYSS